MISLLMYISTLLGVWQFAHEQQAGVCPAKDDQVWQTVSIPHDWAIAGPFDRANDLQVVAVVQNGEQTASAKTGRSGGLPWMGSAWYTTQLTVDDVHLTHYLLFDGAMSHPQVYVNEHFVGEWQYGYNSFWLDITDFVHPGDNEVAVRLENKPESSRWYPGAGLYRKVRHIAVPKTHIAIWGQHYTTPFVTDTMATVQLDMDIVGWDKYTQVSSELMYEGQPVARCEGKKGVMIIKDPQLWSPETPHLYELRTRVCAHDSISGDSTIDIQSQVVGIRKVEFIPGIGFLLNGQKRKFQGVCLHHDLGPLGAAVNEDALVHQLTMLKDMGCDAIRTSHNMPAPELVSLCERMGFMVMIEPFDEWTHTKCKNGYANYFEQWAEADMTNMIVQYRNSPAVVMWSIGNEVWDQTYDKGYLTAKYLQDICHRLDPTRLVTCGMDQVLKVLDNGFAAELDIPGFNYRTMRYEQAYKALPQRLILGSETSSTVSSRGSYYFPAILGPDMHHPDQQSSGYDIEYCAWSGLPDQDFALQDDYDWTIGQFVWTGFDYLGEPSPYDTDAWPSHSSYFGIVDLASLPKDRYYLYRSQWRKDSETLHVLPHWSWDLQPGTEIPVYVYTSYPEAELFVNGVSQGRLRFATKEEAALLAQGERIEGVSEMPQVGDFEVPEWGSVPRPDLLPRYRLMWQHVTYEPGELKVVAYKKDGSVGETKIVRTAGKPHHLQVEWANKNEVYDRAGKKLAYLTVSVVDKHGELCPESDALISAKVKGGRLVGAANGDPTCLDGFTQPKMHAFKGQCTFIVEGENDLTKVILKAQSIQTNQFLLQ